MCIFDKINVFRLSTFKNVFERGSSEVLLPDALELKPIQKYRLHCHGTSWNITGRCVLVGVLQIANKTSKQCAIWEVKCKLLFKLLQIQ